MEDLVDPDTVAGGVVSRDELYELVWAEPMLKVAKQFGVSSRYMARVCTAMNVPWPERGYWTELGFGNPAPQPALPESRPGDQLAWGRGIDLRVSPRASRKQPPVLSPPLPKSATKRNGQHSLVARVKPLFESGRLAHRSKYLKPAKRLLIDLAVSKTGLDRALSFADALFSQLEDRGHHIVIAPEHERFRRAAVDHHEVPLATRVSRELWVPRRPTVVYVGTLAIGLTIIELSELTDAKSVNGEYVRLKPAAPRRMKRRDLSGGRITKHDFPSNRLCLQAYSPYLSAEWTKQWREIKGEDLKKRIPTIIKDLMESVPKIVKLIEEGERNAAIVRRQWEETRKRREREEAERIASEAQKKSKQQLIDFIDSWAKAKCITEFFNEITAQLSSVDAERCEELKIRLERARDLIGAVDPLQILRDWQSPEELLGTSVD
jgi:hypothetical protein